MGLFDFLKKKPETPKTPPAASPNPPSTAPTPAATGPRYKGSNYTLPTTEPVPPMPAMPLLPEPTYGQPASFPFPPTNVLEELLLRAVNEPNLRPAFYQALLHEELLAVTLLKEGDAGGEVPLTPGMEIQLQVLNDGKIPLFSSAARIFEGGLAPEGVSYIKVRGQDLLQMVQATDCVLNPFSPAGKLLSSQEMQELLTNDLLAPADGAAADQQIPVQIGAPATPPTELLAVLGEFCATRSFIEQAYLAELRPENSPEPPRLLLAFLTDDQQADFLQDLGPVIEGRLEGYQFVDMMVLNPTADEPLNQYFAQQEPFYRR